LPFSIVAQEIREQRKVQKLNYDQFHQKKIETSSTALVLKSLIGLGPFVDVQINGELIQVPIDPDGIDYTYFISYEEVIENVEVFDDRIDEVYLINSGAIGNQSMEWDQYAEQDLNCDFTFNAILQSSWRSGLQAPNYSRSFTDVTHLIIHHSAGSNTNANYTQVVRDIYLYHTEVNGWSDIGYNFLISQDGTIFTGRDPANGDQDNVRGAHFCGANTNTMGICLLGNYEIAQPTDLVLRSLETILTFKTDKEEIDPLASSQHINGFLPNIAGHRDGCATLCPGENIYRRFADIRLGVADRLDDCVEGDYSLDFIASNINPELKEAVQFDNLSYGYDSYRWYFEDAAVDTTFWQVGGFSEFIVPGNKDVSIVGITENRQDTLVKKEYILVNQQGIYPTLITGINEVIYLPQDEQILDVALISMNGAVTSFPNPLASQIMLPPSIPNGIYTLRASINGVATIVRILVMK
jgi:hypothetical protein